MATFRTYSKPVLLRPARDSAIIESYVAEEAISQGQVVAEGGTNADEVEPSDTDGERCHGIALFDAAAGEMVDVLKQGYARVTSGTNSVSAGDPIASHGATTEGSVDTAASGDHVFGVARFAASGSNAAMEAYVDFVDSGSTGGGIVS